MPKQSAKVEFNNFTQGFITEASPLNFPQNATSDEQNFEISRKGLRQRRNGIDFETDHFLREAVLASYSTFNWNSAGGNPTVNFLVVHLGNNLYIFDIQKGSISSEGYLATLDLTSLNLGFAVGGGPALFDREWSFAAVDGKLVIVSGSDNIAIISYENNSFSISYDRLKTRDLWGVEVGEDQLETDSSFRPDTLSESHNYNLQNQSWGVPRKGEIVTEIVTTNIDPDTGNSSVVVTVERVNVLMNPIVKYKQDLGKYPSNSETVWAGLQFQPVQAGTNPFERLYTNLYEEAFGADTKASKGYFIIDLLRRGNSRSEVFSLNQDKNPVMAGFSVNFPSDITPGGATVTASYAGRVWYAGFSGEVINGDSRSPSLNNCVFFSKLVKSESDFVKCYQEGDPTSRENNDIVDTDGGFIKLAGAENIISMRENNDKLIVIASNGVWAIGGGSDYGFGATNYAVKKLSSFGGISAESVTEDGNRLFYWGKDGIYVIEQNQTGDTVVSSITENSIQTFYETIPNLSKETSKGVYDSKNKTVRWLYKTGDIFTSTSETYELVLNTSLPAFTRNKIMNTSTYNVEVFSFFSSADFNLEDQVQDVVVSGDVVQTSAVDVYLPLVGRINSVQSTRYLTVVKTGSDYSFTFAYYNNPDFQDWPQVSAVDAYAYMVTGAQTAGDSSVPKQIPYLTMHMNRTEDGVGIDGIPLTQSGCLVSFAWDWANNSNTVKFGSTFQVYKYRKAHLSTTDYDTGFSVITSKNKVRGRGKAFSMKMETQPLKDCQILGWSLPINGNAIT
jgi:hypothetical protein